MRLGLVLDPAGDPGEAAEEALLAERLGFDLVSAGEHVFFHNQDFEPLADRYLLHGGPAGIATRLDSYATAGVETVLFAPACRPERRRDVVELFAEAVRPLMRS